MDPTSITRILEQIAAGDEKAVDELLPVLYQELKKLANHHLEKERPDHTLQPTALVHEAYLKMADQDRVEWKNKAQFMAIASRVMRRILVDHARGRAAKKRGGDVQRITLDEALAPKTMPRTMDLLALDQSLTRLGEKHPEKASLVEMRFFGGLKEGEIAEVLGISSRTVVRHWKFAQAWLYRDLRINPGG
jgi:RNA polymerase sigma factor (TIGR02999 family)